jgi:radical SAM protein with 4Fe4S-binding SPASM domain
MFSMHSPIPSGLNEFMGSENAWQTMIAGVDECHKAGVPVAFNICLVREGFHDGRFEALMENARNFGAAIVQIIKPKPAGGWLVDGAEVFTNQDFARVEELVNKYNHNRAYRDYPAISAQMLEESSEMFGCTAGGTDRFYINAKGDVQPCEFLNISFGNIASEDFDIIYSRMRMHFDKPCQAWLCEACSGQIRKIMQENGVTSLPLDAEMSKKIYLGWDRGEETELYSTLRKIS